MNNPKQIRTALISVYHKEGLDRIITKLNALGVKILSTGGTAAFIESLGVPVDRVEDLTGYPGILGGRVKTLHPKVFGGILSRREDPGDQEQLAMYEIPEIDLVVVDLYPFSETVASGAEHQEIIEKIDIGGISLIRAAAKNYDGVVIIPSKQWYPMLQNILEVQAGKTSQEERYNLAVAAFAESSRYDSAIYNHLAGTKPNDFRYAEGPGRSLRYGENPHQAGIFYGDLQHFFDQLHGKEISYNNLLDIESAVALIDDFEDTTIGIIKHNNACGFTSRPSLTEAWKLALASDPLSAFGGIIVTNRAVDIATAEEIHKLFFEIILAPDYEAGVLEILKQKKNRIILRRKSGSTVAPIQFRSLLGGVLLQDRDTRVERQEELKVVTTVAPSAKEIEDLLFANKLVKHTKSNAIVLVRDSQLLASGTGQTSRVDALKQAIAKAREFGFDPKGAVMASDAFFPFADSVEIAFNAGIRSVIQPGGSVRDQESIDYCNQTGMSMVYTGIRHFKH